MFTPSTAAHNPSVPILSSRGRAAMLNAAERSGLGCRDRADVGLRWVWSLLGSTSCLSCKCSIERKGKAEPSVLGAHPALCTPRRRELQKCCLHKTGCCLHGRVRELSGGAGAVRPSVLQQSQTLQQGEMLGLSDVPWGAMWGSASCCKMCRTLGEPGRESSLLAGAGLC